MVCPVQESRANAVVEAGVLELTETQWLPEEILSLQGSWCFFPSRFVGPEVWPEIEEGCSTQQPVPLAWGKTLGIEGAPEVIQTGQGFGSYALLVKLNPNEPAAKLALRWERAFSAMSAYIYSPSHELIVDPVFQGRPGRDIASTIPVLTSHVVPFSTRGLQSFLVVFHVSNFRYFQGGLWFTPTLSSAETGQQAQLSQLLLDMVVFGILVVVALYHLILFLQRRQDKTPLYFALFCAGIALRLGVMAHFVESLGFARSEGGYEFLLTLEYMTAPLAIIGAGLFLAEMMPSTWFRRLVNVWFVGMGCLLLLFTALVSALTFSSLTWLYEVHVAGAAMGGVVHLSQQVRKKQRVAKWVMFAFVVLVVGAVNDIAHIEGLITTAHVAPYFFVVFVLIQSAILAQNFAETVNEKTTLSLRVLEQTERLAEETRLRADAERELRLELEAKVTLLGDAVHHLNNPLNHIQGVSRSLVEHHRDLLSQFEAMLPPEAERDSMADTIISQFKARFAELDSSTSVLSNALGRASDTVVSLRVLSGVDGVSYAPCEFDEIWAGFVRRSPLVSSSITVEKLGDNSAWRCFGTPVAYAIAIELILVHAAQVDATLEAVRLRSGDLEPEDEPGFWILEFDFSRGIEDADWLRVQTAIGYLLRPYWCEAKAHGDSARLEILRKMPDAFS